MPADSFFCYNFYPNPNGYAGTFSASAKCGRYIIQMVLFLNLKHFSILLIYIYPSHLQFAESTLQVCPEGLSLSFALLFGNAGGSSFLSE